MSEKVDTGRVSHIQHRLGHSLGTRTGIKSLEHRNVMQQRFRHVSNHRAQLNAEWIERIRPGYVRGEVMEQTRTDPQPAPPSCIP